MCAMCVPELNARFLTEVKTAAPALTVYNLMEILGVLSFNLSAVQLRAWPDWLKARHSLAILSPELNDTSQQPLFEQIIYHLPLARMTTQPTAFLDTLAIEVAERTPDVTLSSPESAPLRKQDSSAGANACAISG